MPFSTGHLLPSIKSTFQTAFRSFGGLAIQDRSAGLSFLSKLQPHFFPQQTVQTLPSAIRAPHTKIMIDRFPRWQIAWQHAPRTTALQQVENTIQDLPPAMLTRTTCFRFGWQVWSNFRPLSIIKVGWV